jgi:diguanylate cyclase (GGDEF)-like protein/PAS domain S-box-containing protein
VVTAILSDLSDSLRADALAQALGDSAITVYLTDRWGRIRQTSRRPPYEVDGRVVESLVGRWLPELVPDARPLLEGIGQGLVEHLRWSGRLEQCDDLGRVSAHEIWVARHEGRDRRDAGLVVTVMDVTARAEAERALRRSEELLSRSQAITHIGSWEWDRARRRLTWTDEVFRIVGVDPASFDVSIDSFLALVPSEDRSRIWEAAERSARDGVGFDLEHRIVRPDGEVRYVRERGDPVDEPDGTRVVIGTVHDITEERVHLLAVESSEGRVRAVLNAMSDLTVVLDATGAITMVNDAWRSAAATMGDGAADVGLGADYLAVADAGTRASAPGARIVAVQLRELLAGRLDRFVAEYPCERPDGSVQWFSLTAEAIAPPTAGAVLMHRDITQHKRAEVELRRLALHDLLTGLPNRQLVIDRIEQALHRGRGPVGVMLLDLDRFKLVNDSLGHAVGDMVLMRVAERLRAAVRHGDTVGRLGGDEFVVVCEDLESCGEATRIAEHVLAAFQPPLHVHGRELYVRASLGIETSIDHDADAVTLIRNADTAMYAAKAAGGQRWRVFDQVLRHQAVERLDLEHDLHRALEQRQLHLVYQPKRDLASGRLVGWEALARWDHPERGPVPPVEFITVAEESDLVVDLGRWAVDEACRQLAAWDRMEGLRGASMAVNISARHLSSDTLLDTVVDALDEHLIRPDRLELEVTETAMIHHIELIDANTRRLAALGVRLSLDDFGTGSATLTHVGRLPLHALKIDRSFVSGLALDGGPRGATAIVTSVVAIAHAFGLDVVAEGIETNEQLDALQRLGCRVGQGYLLGVPMHPAKVGPEIAAAPISRAPAP